MYFQNNKVHMYIDSRYRTGMFNFYCLSSPIRTSHGEMFNVEDLTLQSKEIQQIAHEFTFLPKCHVDAALFLLD